MSKFKVGPAKCRNGNDAYIFEIDQTNQGRITAKYKYDYYWTVAMFYSNGKIDCILSDSPYDLMPNVEPEKFKTVCRWYMGLSEDILFPDFGGHSRQTLRKFAGKLTKVTIEVIDEP